MGESRTRRGVCARTRRVATAAVIAAFVTSGLVVATAHAQKVPVPGLTSKSIKLGYVFSGSGAAGSIYQNAGKACQARIDRQNSAGGVQGRKIDLEIVDDATSAANLTVVKDLVENRDVFAVINNSPVGFLSYRYLLDAAVPMIGSGSDGTYYAKKGNENILSLLGNRGDSSDLNYTTVPNVMKTRGATKTAALAYSQSATQAKSLQEYAVPAVGLEPVYTNTAIEFGSEDVGPAVLGIKNSGADAVWLPLTEGTNIAVVSGLQQNGVDLKATILGSGYGQTLLDSPIASTLGPETMVYHVWKPVELKTKATKQFQSDLKKYADITGVPNFGTYAGYIICDLAIQGLEGAGKNPTRQGMIDAIHDMGTFDAAGMACQPVPVGLDTHGKAPETQCGYFLQVKDGKFVVMNKGKAVIGKLVGPKEALAATRSGVPETTTTAPPGP